MSAKGRAYLNLDLILPVAAPLVRRLLRAKQQAREQQFASVPSTPGRVVFLGDSITEWTAWEDWFPSLRTTNRGIGCQAIRDLAARLESAIVAPRAVSLLIGTNDLHGLGVSAEVGAIVAQMNDLVAPIRELAPSALLLVNSVMPRSVLFRERIAAVNRGYAEIASRLGATYVDLWPALANDDGAIRPEMTADGLHLSIAGYAAWAEILRPHLRMFAD